MERLDARSHDGWTIHGTVHRPSGYSAEASGSIDTPLILLHGLSQQEHYWGPVVRRMRSRPILTIDQRGHGLSDAPVEADFSMVTCALDVISAMDALGWEHAVVVGHSWGAAVALACAGGHPTRVDAAVLLDGGLWGPRDLGSRAETRERLRPPALGIPAEELWPLVRSGDLGPFWSSEVQEALEPTFIGDGDGNLRTRIGMDRHMAVLDGLFDFDPSGAIEAAEGAGTPLWVLSAEDRPRLSDAAAASWDDARSQAVRSALARPHVTTLRITGAVHDVPLQWPALVAGILDTVAAQRSAR